MTTHDLKTWPSEYDAVVRGDKTFEVRSELDRDFAVGDVLVLHKWDPTARCYMNAHGDRLVHDADEAFIATSQYVVTYILRGRFGLPPGVCCMSIVPAPDEL